MRATSTVNVPTARRSLAAALEMLGRPGDDDEVRALRSEADDEDSVMGLHHRAGTARTPA